MNVFLIQFNTLFSKFFITNDYIMMEHRPALPRLKMILSLFS